MHKSIVKIKCIWTMTLVTTFKINFCLAFQLPNITKIPKNIDPGMWHFSTKTKIVIFFCIQGHFSTVRERFFKTVMTSTLWKQILLRIDPNFGAVIWTGTYSTRCKCTIMHIFDSFSFKLFRLFDINADLADLF